MLKTNFKARGFRFEEICKVIARLSRFNGNQPTLYSSKNFGQSRTSYGLEITCAVADDWSPELHKFWNFFPDNSSRLDLVLTILAVAERLSFTKLVLPFLTMPSAWGMILTKKTMQPVHIPIMSLVEAMPVHERPAITTFSLVRIVDKVKEYVPAANRINQFQDVAVFAIIIAGGQLD